MQTLRPAFRRDEVVILVFPEDVGTFGDADSDRGLPDEFGTSLDATGREVDLGDEDARVEAVSR